jgi:hypothetical protein
MTTTDEQRASLADASRRLAQLMTERARLAYQARHDDDSELREVIADTDSQIAHCQRELANYSAVLR